MESIIKNFIEKHSQWSEKIIVLRDLLIECGLTETYKWSAPVYTINNKNIISIGAFKNHYGLWFFNRFF